MIFLFFEMYLYTWPDITVQSEEDMTLIDFRKRYEMSVCVCVCSAVQREKNKTK